MKNFKSNVWKNVKLLFPSRSVPQFLISLFTSAFKISISSRREKVFSGFPAPWPRRSADGRRSTAGVELGSGVTGGAGRCLTPTSPLRPRGDLGDPDPAAVAT